MVVRDKIYMGYGGGKCIKKAFTLVEIMAVTVIIGILISVTYVTGSSFTLRGNEAKVKSNFGDMEKIIETVLMSGDDISSYYTDNSGQAGYICYSEFGYSKKSASNFNTSGVLYNRLSMDINGAYNSNKTGQIKLSNSLISLDGIGNGFECNKSSIKDPWNNEYSIYGFSAKGRVDGKMHTKDTVIVYSGGQDSKENGKEDYALIVCKIDGIIKYGTIGFSDNLGNAVVFTGMNIFGGPCSNDNDTIFNTINYSKYKVNGIEKASDFSRLGAM